MNNTFKFGEPFRMKDLSSQCLYILVPIEGYVFPALSLLVVTVNVLAAFVFLQKRVRSHTTFILTLIAGTDVLNIIIPTYFYVYYFSLGYYKDYVTYNMCFLTYILGQVSVEFFNAFSLWLTVLLAYVRCRCLKDPFNAHAFHTSKRITIYVGIILIFTIISHLPALFLFEFSSITYKDQASNATKQLCIITESNLIFQNSSTGRKIQICAETVLDSIVPCFILVYLDFVILLTLKEASITRSSLRRRNTKILTNKNTEKYHERKQQLKQKSNKSVLQLFRRDGQEQEDQINEISSADMKSLTNDNGNSEPKEKTIFDCLKQSCSKPRVVRTKRKLFGKTTSESVDSAFDRLDRDCRRTSWLILMVATIISLHEIPIAIGNVSVLIKHAGVSLPLNVYGCLSVILLLWQYITYLVIFLIYAFMSGAFRSELRRIFRNLCRMGSDISVSKHKVFLSPCSVRKTISRDRDATIDQIHDSDSETET